MASPPLWLILEAMSFFWILAAAAHSFATPAGRCEAELAVLLGNAPLEWRETAPAAGGERVWRARKAFGEWWELVAGRELRLSLVSRKEIRETRFGTGCRSKMAVRPGLDFKNPPSFDDVALARALKRHKAGIIYLWSPGMIYSRRYRTDFAAAAKKLGIAFIPVLDPRAPRGEGLRLNSVELFLRDVTNHYPTTVYFRDGEILATMIGVRPRAEIEQWLEAR